MGTRRGVEVRETSIRIHFSLDGVMHKRTLLASGRPMAPTPANVRYAERIAAEIRERIRHGTFVPAEYFPDDGGVGQGLTVAAQLDTWLAAQRLAPSTRKAYNVAARFWKESIGSEPLRRLRLSQVMTPLAEADLSGKTLNNYTSVLRKAIGLAVADGILTHNVVDEVPAQAHQRPPVEPFSAAEEAAIVAEMDATSAMLGDEVRFRFWTGLRTAEHMALTWGQVRPGSLLIDRSVVRGVVKGTKTDRARTVRLNSVAAAALERQRARAGDPAPDDRVWLDPRYNLPWSDPELFRELYWVPALKAAGVRYRRPYNCRHTHATRMLMAGMTPAFCAGQLGHGVLVFAEIYARWMGGHRDDAEMALLERRIPGTSLEPVL